MRGRGYYGKVTLVSPSGDKITLKLPGRSKTYSGLKTNGWGTGLRQEKRFHRYLSKGWKVVPNNGYPVPMKESKQLEEEKKNTSIVDGSQQTGDSSHGGEHASCEVEDSPNAAEKGKRPRGCRGGQKKRSQKKYSSRKNSGLKLQSCSQSGSVGVYAPQPLKVGKEMVNSAEESAEMLSKLIGRSPFKTTQGIRVNTQDLLIALETGDNPLPPLEDKDERPKLKILVTPDCSGSCQDWNGLSQAWAMHLSSLPDVDVIYVTNSNAEFWEINDEESIKLIQSVDVVLYLGDGDGYDLCKKYASKGATVLALDSYSASVAKPRLKKEKYGQGVLFWVDRVSADTPATWKGSIELCLKP